MALDDEFFVTAGSVVGRDHVRLHKNNQDGVALSVEPDMIVAAVTDGCSSGKHSEVGARLAASFLASWTPALVRRDVSLESLPHVLAMNLESWMHSMASLQVPPGAARDLAGVLGQYFLFTYLVAVVTPERTLVFGEGDGVVSLNGDAHVLDSGPDNAPRYPAYRCLDHRFLSKDAAERSGPAVLADRPTGEVLTLAIGTDGVADLIDRAGESLPDGQLPRGLDQFEDDPRYLKNPSLMHKRLIVLGDGHGRLRDDTTLALIRRKVAA
jgi:hypothetical protein